MALSCRAVTRNSSFIFNTSKPVRWTHQSQSFTRNNSLRVLSSGNCCKSILFTKPFENIRRIDFISIRQCFTKGPVNEKQDNPEKKTGWKGLITKFKEMYRDYWYVLLPVHVATSLVWFGSFYYTVRSGVDVIGILESFGISEALLEPLKNSRAGYFALAFALYKLITPVRYAVTVGGATYAIKRLTAIGWIKPVPSRQHIQKMFQEKKDNLQDRFMESKQHYQTQMKEKRSQVMDEMRRYKTEMRNVKNKVKKM